MCDDGWFGLLWHLCERLEPLVAEFERNTGEKFEVKQKFGGLRFYTGHTPWHRGPTPAPEAIHRCIEDADAEAIRTCEICGQPGRQRDMQGWMFIVCDEHADALAKE